MAILDTVKEALRLTTDSFNSELTLLIAACKTDMRLSGVNRIDQEDELTAIAITLYAKANFGDMDEKGRFQAAYERLRNAMAISGEYGTEGSDVAEG